MTHMVGEVWVRDHSISNWSWISWGSKVQILIVRILLHHVRLNALTALSPAPVYIGQSLLASFWAEELERTINVDSDFVRNDCEPLGGSSSNLVFIVLKPLFDVDEVGVKSPLVTRVYHPNDECKFNQSVDVAPVKHKQVQSKWWANTNKTYAVML